MLYLGNNWRGGRAVEGARLESVYTGNCIVGSNPIPSTIIIELIFFNMASKINRVKFLCPQIDLGRLFKEKKYKLER
jgi:hypothetical protein